MLDAQVLEVIEHRPRHPVRVPAHLRVLAGRRGAVIEVGPQLRSDQQQPDVALLLVPIPGTCARSRLRVLMAIDAP